jgi:hemolysin III
MLPEDRQEKANVITHGVGIILAIIGTFPMLSLGWFNWQPHHLIGLSIFCTALLLVFIASTIYHSVSGPLKKRFKTIDHICIFLLIGGSHTPFVLRYLNNDYGQQYLLILWSLIAFGIIYKLFLIDRWKWLSLIFYLFLGWMAIFIMPSLKAEMPDYVFDWILIGGISYSLGAVFYAWKKLPYSHAIWHIFVIGGSFSHWLAMLYAYQV